MKIGVFSAKSYDRHSLSEENARAGAPHELVYLDARLDRETASLGAEYPAVCVFVNDRLDADVLATLAAGRTRLVALRCAGFNNVDLEAARRLELTVARVPAYSPYAVAEHTVALILTLERKIHRAVNRVREGNSRSRACSAPSCTATPSGSSAPGGSAPRWRACCRASA